MAAQAKSPAPRRTGESRAESSASWSSESAPNAKSAPIRSADRPLDQRASGVGDLGEDRTAVVGVGPAHDQPVGLEPLHDRGDRGRVHLEPLPHLAQRQRAPRGEAEQHQRLVAREGEPVRLEDRVEPAEHELLYAHQRRDGVHRGDAVPSQCPLPGGLVDRIERQRHGGSLFRTTDSIGAGSRSPRDRRPRRSASPWARPWTSFRWSCGCGLEERSVWSRFGFGCGASGRLLSGTALFEVLVWVAAFSLSHGSSPDAIFCG